MWSTSRSKSARQPKLLSSESWLVSGLMRSESRCVGLATRVIFAPAISYGKSRVARRLVEPLQRALLARRFSRSGWSRRESRLLTQALVSVFWSQPELDTVPAVLSDGGLTYGPITSR